MRERGKKKKCRGSEKRGQSDIIRKRKEQERKKEQAQTDGRKAGQGMGISLPLVRPDL